MRKLTMVNSVIKKPRHGNSMDTSAHYDLIERYADICSRALLQNKDRFPFKQILGAAQKSERERPIEVVLSDSIPPETYVFRLQADGVDVKPHALCDECACVRSWSTNISYLMDVTKNSQVYINNPAKLDWEWMYDS